MPRPRVRVCFAACLALALFATPPIIGCDKQGLVATSFPSEGIELRYDLQPGAAFEGEVRRRENVSSRGQTMNRSVDFTVQLLVTAVDADGTARVAATIPTINLNWNIPGLPISMNEFNAKAKKRLEGVTIRFAIRPDGSVELPPLPPDFGEAETGVLESLVDGLTAAFFVVPDKRLMAGESWEDKSTRGREGKLGKYVVESVRGTVVGMFERRTEDKTHNVAKLEIDADKTETTTTKDGSTEIRTRSDTTVLFDTAEGYMAVIESTQIRSQGATTTTVEFKATWNRRCGGAAAKAGEDKPPEVIGGEVQSITDPCDDDYVGPNDCMDPCNSNYMGDDPCNEAGPEAGPEVGPEPAPESSPEG